MISNSMKPGFLQKMDFFSIEKLYLLAAAIVAFLFGALLTKIISTTASTVHISPRIDLYFQEVVVAEDRRTGGAARHPGGAQASAPDTSA